VPSDRARQHQPLQIAALRNKVLHLVSMRNSRYILLDDRPIIQYLRHIVAGCSDQLHTARMRRMIWLRADKRRQKRVMHIDDRGRIVSNEAGVKICI